MWVISHLCTSVRSSFFCLVDLGASLQSKTQTKIRGNEAETFDSALDRQTFRLYMLFCPCLSAS